MRVRDKEQVQARILEENGLKRERMKEGIKKVL